MFIGTLPTRTTADNKNNRCLLVPVLQYKTGGSGRWGRAVRKCCSRGCFAPTWYARGEPGLHSSHSRSPISRRRVEGPHAASPGVDVITHTRGSPCPGSSGLPALYAHAPSSHIYSAGREEEESNLRRRRTRGANSCNQHQEVTPDHWIGKDRERSLFRIFRAQGSISNEI